MDLSKCVVVFPVYRQLTSIERDFLENGVKKTPGFRHVIVAPESLNIDDSFGSLKELSVVRFDNDFFKNIQGYNKLMLSLNFYQRFNEYEYLLIHQPDVYLFKEELYDWCLKGFDYIGAPWFRPNKLNKGRLFYGFYKKFLQPRLVKDRKKGWLYNKVGNGGLSLRKIDAAISILKSTKPVLMQKYLEAENHNYNEDIFWSIEAPSINPSFQIPEWKVALHFAVEFEPKKALKTLNGELPFGCHAPQQMNCGFWSKQIPSLSNIQ